MTIGRFLDYLLLFFITGQKLNPTLHRKNPQSSNAQFADAPSAASNPVPSTDNIPNLIEAVEIPQSNAVVTNGMPAGAEGELQDHLSDEKPDSSDEDVFGGDDVYMWRRKPTVEGIEETDVTNDIRTLPDTRDVQTSKVKVSSDSVDAVVRRKPHSIPTKEQTYQTDKNLYIPPVVKSVTDLYNLPVNGITSTSTDGESSLVDESEGAADEPANKIGAEREVLEPVKWPGASQDSQGASNFSVKPAGIEEGTLFEAMPSPQRSTNIKSAPTLPVEVQRNESPPIPDLLEYEDAEEDLELEDPQNVTSPQNTYAQSHSTFSEQKPASRYCTPKGPVSNRQRSDQQRYIPPKMRNMPPRFQKQLPNNKDNSSSHSQFNHHESANHHALSNDMVESGSESTYSSSTSSSSSSGARRKEPPRHFKAQNASSKPITFGEMMAQLSDQGERDSDSSFGENISPNRRQRDIFGNNYSSNDNLPTSSENDEKINYDQIIASRASRVSPAGRGRARALTMSVDQFPARRKPKVSHIFLI